MTDFYALLKQSIIERDIRDSTARETVYAQAREAIIKQLWAFKPPLAADEIDTRVGAYDSAVERIEADLREEFASGAIPEKPRAERQRAEQKASPPPPPPPEPEPVEEEEIAEEDAPPFVAWHNDHGDDGYADDDSAAEVEDDDTQGIPRAGRSVGRAEEARLAYDEDAAYADEGTDDAQADRQPHQKRWSDAARSDAEADTGAVGAWWRVDWSKWLGAIGRTERQRIQILGGAVAGLCLALVILGSFMWFSRAPRDEGVTFDIGVRREVSDAATAARIPNDTMEVSESYSVFDGRDPTVFESTPGNPVRFVSEGGFARVSSSVSSPGVKVLIGPGLAARLAGRNVRVTLIARAAPDNGALNMRFAYQSGLAISHWQTANLEPEYEAQGMLWRVPTLRTAAEGDQLLIEPGIPGDGTSVDIQSIKIDVLAGEGS